MQEMQGGARRVKEVQEVQGVAGGAGGAGGAGSVQGDAGGAWGCKRVQEVASWFPPLPPPFLFSFPSFLVKMALGI